MLARFFFFSELVFFMIFLGCKQNPPPPPPPANPAPIYIQYHTWFARSDCPSHNPGWEWWHWTWRDKDNPCKTIGTNWLRILSSPGYPIIGPYDSSNPEVVRWHIRLAKAAGVKGFFVSIFAEIEKSWNNFEIFLKVAEEEGFQIGIEGWMPDEDTTPTEWMNEVVKQIEWFAYQSPHKAAFLRINGRPAYWFNIGNKWTDLATAGQFMNRVSAYWLMAAGYSKAELEQLARLAPNSTVNQIVYTRFPTKDGWSLLNPLGGLEERKKMGLEAIAHSYPGFDERFIATTPDRPNRYGLRGRGQAVREFLQQVHGKADMILFESFNDWNEYTMFEPGFDTKPFRDEGQEEINLNRDPYTYLRILADYAKVNFIPPPISCAIVDPLLKEFGIVKESGEFCEPVGWW